MINPGSQFVRNGIVLTVDFVENNEVFYKQHRVKTKDHESYDEEYERWLGCYRVPIDVFEKAVHV